MRDYYLGVLTCRLHKDLSWSIYLTAVGFYIVGDSMWADPIQFHELFDPGYAFGDSLEETYYE
jgi:hypothetical protein